MKIGVLVSGGGSNLGALIAARAAGQLDVDIAVVISNVATAGGLDRARAAGIPAFALEHKAFASREAFDAEVVRVLREHGVTLVVLAGFMRLVTKVLLDAFPQRVVNVHPALLPAFPGVHSQGQALRYGVRIAGVTVHFVDGGTDTGPILAQAAVPVRADDTDEALVARILKQEHALLPRVVQWIAEGRVSVEDAGEGQRPRVVVRGAETAVFAEE